MKIPCPIKLGETENNLSLNHISWFKWSHKGWEFTYGLCSKNDGPASRIKTNKDYEKLECAMNVADELLEEGSLQSKGYPFRGTGYIYGYRIKDKKLYADILLTGQYYHHLYCECDENGYYKENGSIIFPPIPSFDDAEKRRSILLKRYHHLA